LSAAPHHGLSHQDKIQNEGVRRQIPEDNISIKNTGHKKMLEKVPNIELRDLYSLTNTVSGAKSRIRWAERVARKAEKESA
jgi:hypothetical protein